MTLDEAEKIKSVVENKKYIEQLVETVSKMLVEAFENIKIEDVDMFRLGYNKAIDDFTKWYEDHEHKRGFPYTIGNIKTCLSSEGIVREFKIAKQKVGDGV